MRAPLMLMSWPNKVYTALFSQIAAQYSGVEEAKDEAGVRSSTCDAADS